MVVPVYNVEGFLRECLDSILSQSYRDLELIAVEDCSTDGSADILDEIAGRDDRVKVVKLPENGGLGNARNEGLARAVGDLVLFVDSDDSLAGGALEILVDRADETAADVVLFDYARTYWWGKQQRNVLGGVIGEAPGGVFTIDDHYELFEVLNVIWNKLYRRDFLQRFDMPFPDGYYEDIPWTYPALMAARSITVVDRVLYFYRQRRGGNILRTQTRRHFDIFLQYDRLFAWLAEHPEKGEFAPYFFDKMVDHTLGMWAAGSRLPGADRREFFEEIGRRIRQYRPEGHSWPGGLTGLRHRLVASDRYFTYKVFKTINRVQRFTMSQARSFLKWGRQALRSLAQGARRVLYRLFLLLPVDRNLAVFAAYWSGQYAGNPKAIYEEMRRSRPDIRGVWSIREADRDAIPEGVESAVTDSIKWHWVLARAGVVVNNVNFPNWVVKREGTLLVQTQHGTPLKSMGLDLRNFAATNKSMHFGLLLERVDKWDYNLSSNRYSSEIWKRVFPSSFVNLEFGYPRNDILVNGDDDAAARVREVLGVPPGMKLALYAPTFRDYRSEPTWDLDPALVAEALGPDGYLAVRAHYFDELQVDGADRILDASGLDVQELLLATDILITDYSSIMFDYAILGRPIVTYAPDWEDYARERGVYFDLLAEPPGAVAQSQRRLVQILQNGEYESEESWTLLKAFQERFCSWEEGTAARRVVEVLWPG